MTTTIQKLDGAAAMKPLFLLDRDGVVVVNRPTNIKTPRDLVLLPRAAEAIARLNRAGYRVAICTNQPELARGVMSRGELDRVHDALHQMLAAEGAMVDFVLCCGSARKCPRRKPFGGMLRDALAHCGAPASQTPFVGDQLDDLKAAFHAGCRRVLVRTGLGARRWNSRCRLMSSRSPSMRTWPMSSMPSSPVVR